MFLIAGLFGSLLAAGKNSTGNMKQDILSVASGTLSAYYLTPLIFEVLQIDASQNAQCGVAFLLGVLGMRGVEQVFRKVVKTNTQTFEIPK